MCIKTLQSPFIPSHPSTFSDLATLTEVFGQLATAQFTLTSYSGTCVRGIAFILAVTTCNCWGNAAAISYASVPRMSFCWRLSLSNITPGFFFGGGGRG